MRRIGRWILFNPSIRPILWTLVNNQLSRCAWECFCPGTINCRYATLENGLTDEGEASFFSPILDADVAEAGEGFGL